MNEPKTWLLAWSRFEAFRRNLPTSVDEERVLEYHSILEGLETASAEDLGHFRIPEAELKPEVASFSFPTRRRPAVVNYTDRKYCDQDFFLRQVEGVWRYLQDVGLRPAVRDAQAEGDVNESTDYWSMNDVELERLAIEYNIPPVSRAGAHGEHWYIDRDRIIDALVKRDSVLRAAKGRSDTASNILNVGNMYGSSIQQASPGSEAVIDYRGKESAIEDLLERVVKAINEMSLSPAAKGQIEADVDTVKAQLTSPNPKTSIITECLASIKTILESAAGNLLASGLAHEMGKLMD